MDKKPFPVERVRKYLEPGPILLVSSRVGEETNIMTLGWHMVMEFTPSLVACMISGGNHSFELIRESEGCVLNLPTADMVDTVVGIGNTTGAETDKFAHFGLTPEPADEIDAPLIAECHASFECALHDDAMVDRYNVFIFEVIAAHVRPKPEFPETLHYTGDGVFSVPCRTIDRAKLFTRIPL